MCPSLMLVNAWCVSVCLWLWLMLGMCLSLRLVDAWCVFVPDAVCPWWLVNHSADQIDSCSSPSVFLESWVTSTHTTPSWTCYHWLSWLKSSQTVPSQDLSGPKTPFFKTHPLDCLRRQSQGKEERQKEGETLGQKGALTLGAEVEEALHAVKPLTPSPWVPSYEEAWSCFNLENSFIRSGTICTTLSFQLRKIKRCVH